MQPYQYALAAGIALLVLLTALPFLFALAKGRAFSQGKAIGLGIRDTTHAQQLRAMKDELEDIAIQREAEQRRSHTSTAELKGINLKLEARIKTQDSQLQDTADELAKSEQSIANLKRTITELEMRIMSYTGLAVTKSDYEQLTKAAETLQLAQRTWETAKGTEPWCIRAHNGALSIQNLARRIHAQLRNTPTSTTKAGEPA